MQRPQRKMLNLPQPCEVREDADGSPFEIMVGGRWQRVESVLDHWRIVDEWWRAEQRRGYWRLTVDNGLIVTVYRDDVRDEWYRQEYTPPPLAD